jgi:c(7)-type cytochrome triheme protein
LLIVGFVLVSFTDTRNGRDTATAAVNDVTFAPAVGYADFNPPGETVIEHQEDSPGPVLFDHTTHTDLDEPGCRSCHSGAYSMLGKLAPPRDWSQVDFHGKGYCGRCHNGDEAFDLSDDGECGTCHME